MAKKRVQIQITSGVPPVGHLGGYGTGYVEEATAELGGHVTGRTYTLNLSQQDADKIHKDLEALFEEYRPLSK